MSKSIRATRDDIMGMPITIEIVPHSIEITNQVFLFFSRIDTRFSTYKPESEIMQINRGEILETHYSSDMQTIFSLAQQTKELTNGFFSIYTPQGTIDPSGIVKGWAIYQASKLVEKLGCTDYFIDIAGDIQSHGTDSQGNEWTVGIRNPFNEQEIIKVVTPNGQGIATSGTSIRGQHIYNPHSSTSSIDDIASITVLGPNIYEADRFATAAFAMGVEGIAFIENLSGFEGYQINADGIATMTSNFNNYTT